MNISQITAEIMSSNIYIVATTGIFTVLIMALYGAIIGYAFKKMNYIAFIIGEAAILIIGVITTLSLLI